MRIRCSKCSRVRVLFRENQCRACWRNGQPRYRVVRLAGGQTRRIGSAKVALQQGRARGAESLHASGQAYRWSSETARAAALKMWKLNPVNKRIGVRLGRPAKNRKPLRAIDRAAIRRRHAGDGSGTVWWSSDLDPRSPGVWRVSFNHSVRRISERAALIRLGYLPNPRGFVPRVVDPYQPSPPKPGKVRPATGTTYAPVNPPNPKPRKKETP